MHAKKSLSEKRYLGLSEIKSNSIFTGWNRLFHRFTFNIQEIKSPLPKYISNDIGGDDCRPIYPKQRSKMMPTNTTLERLWIRYL